jgi:hypothetical protein
LNGRIAFVCWGPLDSNPWFKTPLEIGIRRLGEPEPLPPRAPGPMAFSDPDYVREILAAAGFRSVEIREEHPMLRGHQTVQEEASLAMTIGPTSRLIALKKPDPPTLAAMAAELAMAFRPCLTDDGMRVPCTILTVTAQAP